MMKKDKTECEQAHARPPALTREEMRDIQYFDTLCIWDTLTISPPVGSNVYHDWKIAFLWQRVHILEVPAVLFNILLFIPIECI